jgi:hypothetical protein
MLRITEMRGRLLGLFDKEQIAARVSVTDNGGAPRTLALEFILPGQRVADMDRLDHLPPPRSSLASSYAPQPAQPALPAPMRIAPHPDDLVFDKVQPSAFAAKRGGFKWE